MTNENHQLIHWRLNNMSHRRGPHMFEDKKKKTREVEDKILWKWMLSYLKEYKWLFIGLTVFLFVFTISSAFVPMLQKSMIDTGILAENWEITMNYIMWIAAFTIFSTLGSGFINYHMGKIGTEVIYKVRAEIFGNLQNMSMDYYDKSHSGDIISIATNDVDQLNLIFGGQLAQTISDGFRGILMIVLMLKMNWELAIISLLIIPVFGLFMMTLRKKAKKMFKKTRKAISEVTQKAEENISGMKVIQAYGKQESAAKEFDMANLKNQQALLNTRKIFAYYIPLISFIMSIFSSLILLYGGYGVLNNEISLLGNSITLGTLQAMSNYLMQLFMPIMSIMMFQQLAEAALAASERIYKLLHEQTEILDPETPEEFSDVKGTIEFKNITFSYSEREVKDADENQNEDDILAELPQQQQERLKKLQGIPFEQQQRMLQMMPDQQRERISAMLKLMTASSEIKAKKTTKAKKARKQGKMKVKMTEMSQQMMAGMAKQFQEMLKDPKNLLKLAKVVEKQSQGGSGPSISAGNSGQMGGGGQMGGSGGGMGLGMMPKERILDILGSDKVPEDIYEQFSPTVHQLIKEHKEIEAHKLSTGEIIKNVSFTIPAGKTIAIVGPTGAGKTTLIKLLARFYDLSDDKGDILIDGKSIKNIKKEDLRKTIGMVPQDSFLFTNSILENLYYGKPLDEKPVLTEELMDISKFLGLHNFIDNMPENYNTPLMENASNLSVGQRQLIAFARVLMVDPKILILDEATSSVDPYTETLIQDALNKAKKGRTTIIIAHRLSTIKNADEIYVLEQGKFVEHGSHDELMTLDEHYAHLVAMQAQDIKAN